MPIVTIRIGRPNGSTGQPRATQQQKAALIKGVSDLVLSVLNHPPHSTFVVIEDVDVEEWGLGGEFTARYRRWFSNPPSGEQAS